MAKEYRDIFKQINEVIQFRNKLAHCLLDVSEEFLAKKYTDRIQLLYYDSKGRKVLIEITDTQIREKLKNCTSIIAKLTEIRSKIDKSKNKLN